MLAKPRVELEIAPEKASVSWSIDMKNGLAKNIAEQIIAQIPMVGKWRSAFIKHSTPGHFYSPIPDLAEVKRREAKIFAPSNELYGIDLSSSKQLNLLNEIVALLPEAPWANEQRAGLLYQYQNLFFGPGDGLALYGLMRTMKPSKIIEVGSGWSSALMLDVNKQFFDNSIHLTFIEPNPERLLEVTKGVSVEFRREFIQEVPLSTYDGLSENDILFIDTSHVSKVGSDVNFIIFDILPRLSSGVLVHFHDIFFPF